MRTVAIFIAMVAVSGYYGVNAIPAPESPSSTVPPVIEKMCESSKNPELGLYPNETAACATKAGFTMEEVVKMDFGAQGFDDKCFTKCLLVNEGLLSEEGEPMVEKMAELIKAVFPADYQAELQGAYNRCIADADKNVEAAGGRKAAPCPFALQLSNCLVKEEEEFCKKFKGPK